MVGDPIADMLMRMRNASAVGHNTLTVPFSQMKMTIAKLLEREGYIEGAQKKGKKNGKVIEIELKYKEDGVARIRGSKRMSKPSRRLYVGVRDIQPVMSGYGLLVLSTPKGILGGREAAKERVGGEVLFSIW